MASITSASALGAFKDAAEKPAKVSADVDLETSAVRNDEGEKRQAPQVSSTAQVGEPDVALTRLEKALLVLGAFLGAFVSLGLNASYGQLFAALKSDTGESSSSLALIGSMRDFIFNGSCAFVGFALKDVGHVRMLVAGSVALVLGMFLDSAMPSSAGLFFSYSGMSGLAMALLFLSSTTSIYGRLSPRELPVAVGLTSCGGGVGTFLINHAQSLLIEEHGWRTTQQILALCFLVVLAISASCLYYVLKPGRAPAEDKKVNTTQPRKEVQDVQSFWYGLFEPFSDPSFVLLNLGILLYFCTFTVPYTHITYYAREVRHYESAATLVSTAGAAGIPGRFLCGFAALVIRPSTMFLWMILAQGLLLLWLPLCETPVALEGFAVIWGFISGVRVAVLGLILNELYGADKVAHLFGLVGIAIAVGSLIGPTLAGGIYDITGNYRDSFWTSAGLLFMSLPVMLAAIVWTRRRQKQLTPTEDAPCEESCNP